ncbi:hypothetical protein [Methylobacterium mesophilicum]
MALIRYGSQEFDNYIKYILTQKPNHYDNPYKSERRISNFAHYGIDYSVKDLIDLWNAHKKFFIKRDIPELRLKTACHLIRQGIHHGIFLVTSNNTYISLTLSSNTPQFLHPRSGGTLAVNDEEMKFADQIYEKATRRKIALATAPSIGYILNHWTTTRGADQDRVLGLFFDFPRVNSSEEIIDAAEAALNKMSAYRQLAWAAEVRAQLMRRIYMGDALETNDDVDSISSLVFKIT